MTPAPTSVADPDRTVRPLVVTDSPDLLDDLLRLAAAAGATVHAVGDPSAVTAAWSEAPLVVVGSDQAHACVVAGLPRRRDVVLVCGEADDGAAVWDVAAALGADHVIFLPEAERWLVDLFSDVASATPRRCAIVGVVGGRGGAGATCLAVSLAFAGLRRGMRTVLVDADPLGGGIDLALGIDDSEIPRRASGIWPSSWFPTWTRAQPHLTTGDLTVFSWGRSSEPVIPPTAVTAVMTTVRSSADLICVDLPRTMDATGVAAAQLCQTVLLVVPAEVRAAAAAVRVRERAEAMCDDVRAVVRVPGPGGLAAEVVAQAVGVPLYGILRRENGLDQALERGEPPGTRRRGPLARFSTRFVANLAGDDLDDEAAA